MWAWMLSIYLLSHEVLPMYMCTLYKFYCCDHKNSWYTLIFVMTVALTFWIALRRAIQHKFIVILEFVVICVIVVIFDKSVSTHCVLFIWNYFLINFKGTFVYVLENGLFLFFRKSSQIRSCYEKYKKQIVLWWFMVTKSKLPVQQFKLRVRHARDSTKNNSIDRKQWNTQYYSTFFYDVSVIFIVCKKKKRCSLQL